MLENFISAKTFNHLFKYQAKFLNFVTRWGFMKKTDATYQNLMEWMELIVRLNMIVSYFQENNLTHLVQENHHWI